MALDATYGNALRRMVTDPGSFSGTPGFQFALDNGLQGVSRANAAGGMRGSGNALAAAARYASGLASQDYGAQFDRLLRANQGEQQYDLGATRNANDLTLGNRRIDADLSLGHEQNANAATRNANDLTLGLGQNANNATRNANDLTLGLGQNANNAQRNQFDYNIGMGNVANNATRNEYDYDLGLGQNANTAQRNAFDYDLGLGRNANDASANQNQFNLGMFNAQTNRGNALADIYFRRQASKPHTFNTPGGILTTTPRFG